MTRPFFIAKNEYLIIKTRSKDGDWYISEVQSDRAYSLGEVAAEAINHDAEAIERVGPDGVEHLEQVVAQHIIEDCENDFSEWTSIPDWIQQERPMTAEDAAAAHGDYQRSLASDERAA